MVVAWFVIRTVADVDGRAYLLWVVAAGALALVAPRRGSSCSSRPRSSSNPTASPGRSRPRELIVLPLAARRPRPGRRRPVPLAAGAGDLARRSCSCSGRRSASCTRSGVFDQDFQWHAAQSWIGNMLAPIIILVAAAWTARDGDLRVLVVAIGVGVVAARRLPRSNTPLPGRSRTGRFAWVGFWKGFGGAARRARSRRRTPCRRSSSCRRWSLLAAVLLARDVRLRAIAAGRARAGARRAVPHLQPRPVHRRCTSSSSSSPGGSGAGLGSPSSSSGWSSVPLALPAYLQLRGSSVAEGAVSPGSILVASDEYRFSAWGAAHRDGRGQAAHRAGLPGLQGARRRPSATRSWVRPTTNGCGSSPRRASIVGLVGLAFLVATGDHAGARPGLARDRHPRRVHRLRHRGVVQQPAAVRPGVSASRSRSSASAWRWPSGLVHRATADRRRPGQRSRARAGRDDPALD